MLLRKIGCVIYATWIGGIVGLVVSLPAALVLGPAGIAGVVTGVVAGFLAGVLAVLDTLGPFGTGGGQWLGAEAGLLVTAALVLYAELSGPGIAPATAADWAGLTLGFGFVAGVGFVAGRSAERAGRWAAGTR